MDDLVVLSSTDEENEEKLNRSVEDLEIPPEKKDEEAFVPPPAANVDVSMVKLDPIEERERKLQEEEDKDARQLKALNFQLAELGYEGSQTLKGIIADIMADAFPDLPSAKEAA